MKTDKNKDVLQVRMFGQLSVMWKGQSLTDRLRTTESQYISLLEMLLHMRDKGVPRELLVQTIYGEKDLANVYHCMRTVVYNAKRTLKKTIGEEYVFIESSKGIYKWSGEIEVEEDASRMEVLAAKAREETDPDLRKKRCLEACYAYTGPFLANHIGTAWIDQEARRYRELFLDCMEKTVQILRQEKDYCKLEELARHAARVCPYENWEALGLEALAAMGRHKECLSLCMKTADMYVEETGEEPSDCLLRLLDRMGGMNRQPAARLDPILSALLDRENEDAGDHYASWPVFTQIIRTDRKRLSQSHSFLILYSVVESCRTRYADGPGRCLPDSFGKLGKAINRSLSPGQIFTRYSNGQYLVLLRDSSLNQCRYLHRTVLCRYKEKEDRGVRMEVRRITGEYTLERVVTA